MDVKDQVCSFEQALKLKELGVKQDSLFYYVNNYIDPNGKRIVDGEHIILACYRRMSEANGLKRGSKVDFVSAFSATELAHILPTILPYEELSYGIVLVQMFPDGKEQGLYMSAYQEVYSDYDLGAVVYENVDVTETKSRAGLLIRMLKEKIISLDDIEERSVIVWDPNESL